MDFYFLTIEIPMLCIGIVLWILCCHFARKRREAGAWPADRSDSPSVYIIPIYDEGEHEDEEEEMDINGAYFQPSYREPPMYSIRNVSPPPPYMFEAPSYPDPPPSYTDPPAYSEQP